jgi:hypothetical protein
MDFGHIIETVVSTLFVAGASYGGIRAKLAALHERIERCEKDIRLLTFKKGN